jgi:hypothetical protein
MPYKFESSSLHGLLTGKFNEALTPSDEIEECEALLLAISPELNGSIF